MTYFIFMSMAVLIITVILSVAITISIMRKQRPVELAVINSKTQYEKTEWTEEQIEVLNKFMVYEMGQSPVHGLWYVQMVSWEGLFDSDNKDLKRVWVEEYDTMEEAVDAAKHKVLNEEFMS